MKLLVLMGVGIFLARADETYIKVAAAAYQAGTAALQEQDFSYAVTYCQKAIQIEPTFIEARESLVHTYLAIGQRLQAATSNPDRPKARPTGVGSVSLVLKQEPFNSDALLGFASAAKILGMNNRTDYALQVGHKHYPLDNRFEQHPDPINTISGLTRLVAS